MDTDIESLVFERVLSFLATLKMVMISKRAFALHCTALKYTKTLDFLHFYIHLMRRPVSKEIVLIGKLYVLSYSHFFFQRSAVLKSSS